MNRDPYDDLRDALADALATMGYAPPEIALALALQEWHGCLQRGTPDWLLKSLRLRVGHGDCVTVGAVDRLTRYLAERIPRSPDGS